MIMSDLKKIKINEKKINLIYNLPDYLAASRTGFNTLKHYILRHKEEIQKAILFCLSLILAFILGISLGIGQKQAITAIFKTPEGFDMELDADFFKKIDEMFTIYNNDLKTQKEDGLRANSGFVASKIGKKYYPISCKAAESLSEKNKVYFKTEMEAQRAGYSLSERCK